MLYSTFGKGGTDGFTTTLWSGTDLKMWWVLTDAHSQQGADTVTRGYYKIVKGIGFR